MTEQWKPSTDKPQGESPLRRFSGTLKQYSAQDYEASENRKASRSIVFDFTDVVVLEATEPYPFPTAQIRIRYADPRTSRGGTKWAVWSASKRAACKGLQDDGTLDVLIGRNQEWAVLPGEVRSRDDETGEWSNTLMDCWQVVSVEGAEQASPVGQNGNVLEYVAGLLHGKDEASFYQVLYTDQEVKKHPEIITQATQRTLLPALEAGGLVSRGADGIWTKSGEPVVVPTDASA